MKYVPYVPVLGIRIRMFLGLPEPSIMKQKILPVRKTLISTVL